MSHLEETETKRRYIVSQAELKKAFPEIKGDIVEIGLWSGVRKGEEVSKDTQKWYFETVEGELKRIRLCPGA